MGLIPAFFYPGIKSQGLSSTPKKAHNAQPWAVGHAINPHVPWEWSQPSGKGFSDNLHQSHGKSKPCCCLGDITARPDTGKRGQETNLSETGLKRFIEMLQLWDFWIAGSCQPCTDTDFSAKGEVRFAQDVIFPPSLIFTVKPLHMKPDWGTWCLLSTYKISQAQVKLPEISCPVYAAWAWPGTPEKIY